MSEFKAKDAFSGSSDLVIKTTQAMHSLVITNDGTGNLTFKVVGNTYTLRPGYTFDEELEPFDTIEIRGNGSFFGYTRRRKR